ncbi:MAG TPA: MFS transporter [Anaerolineales bacterium]|nr:MFS transporter [Anaerolineales bacterium]
MPLIHRLKILYNEYPRQYWLMIAGIVIATAGGSMIWPFLLIYASGKLDLPLSTVATLISINAGTGLLSSFIAGSLADKIGRKVVMNFSLTMTGITYFLLMRAETYPQFVGLMIMIGLSNPLYQVGADAMLADMVPSEKRTDAYAINRIANNAAFALGPAVGGFLATRSYDLAFYGAGIGFLIYSALLFFLARETLHKQDHPQGALQSFSISLKRMITLFKTRPVDKSEIDPLKEANTSKNDGYGRVFRDRNYMLFVGIISLGLIAPTMLWILMPVYAKTNYGIPEALYGWIPTTNALMCVFVQYFVTGITRKHPTLPVLGTGMLIYALGVGSVALAGNFWGFWLSMVILTFGELTLVPTASKYVADLAPADLRGRYMSIHWLGWGLARTLAPIIGGFLNDNVAPHAIWIGGLLIGLTSTLGLFLLSRVSAPQRTPLTEP